MCLLRGESTAFKAGHSHTAWQPGDSHISNVTVLRPPGHLELEEKPVRKKLHEGPS